MDVFEMQPSGKTSLPAVGHQSLATENQNVNSVDTTESGDDLRVGLSPVAWAENDLCDFVQAHYARTYAYCYRLCGRQVDAEDLCQQVFVAAIRYAGQIRCLDSVPAWLATTARRLYWKSLRDVSRKANLIQANVHDPQSPQESIETRLEREDWVHRALGDLNPTARVIVMMFYFEDKSYQQIAQELNIPLGTVMSRLSRSKEVLRDALLKSGCSNQDTSLLISRPN